MGILNVLKSFFSGSVSEPDYVVTEVSTTQSLGGLVSSYNQKIAAHQASGYWPSNPTLVSLMLGEMAIRVIDQGLEEAVVINVAKIPHLSGNAVFGADVDSIKSIFYKQRQAATLGGAMGGALPGSSQQVRFQVERVDISGAPCGTQPPQSLGMLHMPASAPNLPRYF